MEDCNNWHEDENEDQEGSAIWKDRNQQVFQKIYKTFCGLGTPSCECMTQFVRNHFDQSNFFLLIDQNSHRVCLQNNLSTFLII